MLSRIVSGPYVGKKGRKRVQVEYMESGDRKVVTYAKYLMENHLGRRLDPTTEQVDHIDRDCTHDVVNNLRVIPKPKHHSDDALRVTRIELVCPECGKKFKRKYGTVIVRRRRNRMCFCSQSCSSVYNALKREGVVKHIIPNTPERIVYRRNKIPEQGGFATDS